MRRRPQAALPHHRLQARHPRHAGQGRRRSSTIPNRTAHIALLAYTNGEKRYILAPEGLQVGDDDRRLEHGDDERLHWSATTSRSSIIPPSTKVHCGGAGPRPRRPDRPLGRHLASSSSASRTATPSCKMPSGEIRLVQRQVPRHDRHRRQRRPRPTSSLGKAGRNRWLGRRPARPRRRHEPGRPPERRRPGQVQGRRRPPADRLPVGPARQGLPDAPARSKISSSFILVHHNGRPPRGKK